MKICPACKTLYSDDTLRFCLQDGTPLADSFEGETPTVVLGETETVAARRADPGMRAISDPGTAAWQQSQVTHVATLGAEKKSSNTTLAVVATAAGMLLLFGVAGIASLIYFLNSDRPWISNANNGNFATPAGNTNYNGQPFISPTPTATRSTSTPMPSNAGDFATPPTRASHPATVRLKFARGAYTTSYSGEINPGAQRSLVLACRAGQSLSASVSNGASCISIRGGGSTLRDTTTSGDNYVTVKNICSDVVGFSISVTVR